MADVYVDRTGTPALFMRIDFMDQDTGDTDPSGYTVTLAVIPAGTRPDDDDYKTAAWATRSSDGYKARVLVGTGTDVGVLTGGSRYDVYARVVAGSQDWRGKSPDTLVVR